MADIIKNGHRASPQETASYISQMTLELKKLAQGADLTMLAYLLEMAREEAATTHADAIVSDPN